MYHGRWVVTTDATIGKIDTNKEGALSWCQAFTIQFDSVNADNMDILQ